MGNAEEEENGVSSQLFQCPIADAFREHQTRFADYSKRGESAMNEISVMHAEVKTISGRTAHLSKLADISVDLKSLADSAREVKDKLLDSATRRSDIPLSIFLITLIGVFVICFGVIVLGSDKATKTHIPGLGSLETTK